MEVSREEEPNHRPRSVPSSKPDMTLSMRLAGQVLKVPPNRETRTRSGHTNSGHGAFGAHVSFSENRANRGNNAENVGNVCFLCERSYHISIRKR